MDWLLLAEGRDRLQRGAGDFDRDVELETGGIFKVLSQGEWGMENKPRPQKEWVRSLGYVKIGEYKGVLYQNVRNRTLWKWRNCIVKADNYVAAIQELKNRNAIPKGLKKNAAADR
ncbi:hypothetical protein [Effusibacillus pohliae]|uniref:hypothetical protein n=1 Tax=Effusibacillus pohliae TaxID=232270 RepID=UPI0012E9DC6F|nr:hypothetical protein [Effusibacillus pohliae]